MSETVDPTGESRPSNGRDPRQPADFDPIPQAKRMVRVIRSGALATLAADGHPLATLTGTATDLDGTPIILVSALSTHTRQLEGDPRASLLLAEGGRGDPLAHPRISLAVTARKLEHGPERDRCRGRYLAQVPKAKLYADFGDFSFWRLEPRHVYLNGGFARAWDGPWADVATDLTGADELIAMAESAVAHMNEDHAEALTLYATLLCGQPEAPWRATGVDPEGLDLAALGMAARVPFPKRITGGGPLRMVLKDLADQARAMVRA